MEIQSLQDREKHPDTVDQLLSDEAVDFSLVDVRRQRERTLVKLPDDLWIPMSKLSDQTDEIKQQPAPRVLYCHRGVRSLRASNMLHEQGVEDVYSLAGGIDYWARKINTELAVY